MYICMNIHVSVSFVYVQGRGALQKMAGPTRTTATKAVCAVSSSARSWSRASPRRREARGMNKIDGPGEIVHPEPPEPQ